MKKLLLLSAILFVLGISSVTAYATLLSYTVNGTVTGNPLSPYPGMSTQVYGNIVFDSELTKPLINGPHQLWETHQYYVQSFLIFGNDFQGNGFTFAGNREQGPWRAGYLDMITVIPYMERLWCLVGSPNPFATPQDPFGYYIWGAFGGAPRWYAYHGDGTPYPEPTDINNWEEYNELAPLIHLLPNLEMAYYKVDLWLSNPTAVPEPSTMLLLGSGLIGLLGLRRKLKKTD